MFTRRIWLSPLARAPQLLDNEIIRQNLAGVFAQQGHDAELAEGEVDILTADTDLVLIVVDDQFSTV